MRRFYWTRARAVYFSKKKKKKRKKLTFQNEARERSVKISGESQQKKQETRGDRKKNKE